MARIQRIPLLDLARTTALVGMVVYHFTYDLDVFGYIAPGTAVSGGWAVFARIVAGSFLFLAGVSLYLAHGGGIRWRGFLKRAAQIGAGAALITVTTWFNTPSAYVFFGILHAILAASVIGLAFLRLPWVVTLGVAVIVVAGRDYFRADIFNAPWLLWVGLSTEPVRSVDYVPAFPWFGPFLAGLALAKLSVATGFTDILRRMVPEGRLVNLLALPGRHSLIIYLLHQPILFGAFAAIAWATR